MAILISVDSFIKLFIRFSQFLFHFPTITKLWFIESFLTITLPWEVQFIHSSTLMFSPLNLISFQFLTVIFRSEGHDHLMKMLYPTEQPRFRKNHKEVNLR